MVKFEWTDKVLAAISCDTEWTDDTRERVSQILKEFNVAQNSTSNNTQSTPCFKCHEFDNSEYRYCPWCGLINHSRYDAHLS